MPVKKRREKSRSLDRWCAQELRTGPVLLAGLGYFDYQAPEGVDQCDTPRMANDWKRHGDSILSEWITQRPGTRPYAWWKFDAPEPRDDSDSEYQYLVRHGLLTEKEIEQ